MFTPTPGESSEELEELKRCAQALNPCKVKSEHHIMAHLQHPAVKQAVRVIILAYLRHCPFLKSAYDSNQPLSRYILALAATKVSIQLVILLLIVTKRYIDPLLVAKDVWRILRS
jgi:hypothetical protein